MSVILLIMAVISMAVWAIVGFFIWVPLLARAAAQLLIASMYTATTGAGISSAVHALQNAVVFYFRGFKWILESISRGASEDAEQATLDWSRFGRFAVILLASLAFWVVTILSLRVLPKALQALADTRNRVLPPELLAADSLYVKGSLLPPFEATSCSIQYRDGAMHLRAVRKKNCRVPHRIVVPLDRTSFRVTASQEYGGWCGLGVWGKGRGGEAEVNFLTSEAGSAGFWWWEKNRWREIISQDARVPALREGLHQTNELQLIMLRDTVTALANGEVVAWQAAAAADSGYAVLVCEQSGGAAYHSVRVERLGKNTAQPFRQ